MDLSLFNKAILLFQKLNKQKNTQKTQVTFHGGEPLLAGTSFYKKALPRLDEVFGHSVKIGIQSNLWNINKEFIDLCKHYRINFGTSLDGPSEINDLQRSGGYYKNTMQGIKKLEEHGIYPGCIATFTAESAKNYKEVFDFFIDKKLHFDIHPAVSPINSKEQNQHFIKPDEFGDLLVNLLKLYLKQSHKIKIGTLDTLIKNVSHDHSGLCTFTKCLGNYLAVDPQGDLYTCNRFVGNKKFSVGNVNSINSWTEIKQSAAWQKLEKWQQTIDLECADCLYKNICHGGCPYNALSSGNGKFIKDPNCKAYKKIYQFILNKGTDEYFSKTNKATFLKGSSSHHKKGQLLQLMNDDPHPYDLANASKKIISAALLGHNKSPNEIATGFASEEWGKSKRNTILFLEDLQKKLTEPQRSINSLLIFQRLL